MHPSGCANCPHLPSPTHPPTHPTAPPADASERALASELRGIGVGVVEVPEWKQQVRRFLVLVLIVRVNT